MPIYEFESVRPVIDATAFVHPTAVVIGDVTIGPGCLVGPGASLRGDIGRIFLHKGSNVQDNCTIHVFPGKTVTVEENGHIGHGTVLHGCIVKRNALVGMNCVIMDDAVIGEEAFVAAMSFVKAETIVPPRTLVAGIPARVIREVSDEEVTWKTEGTRIYQHLAQRYRATLKDCAPLLEAEANRRPLPPIEYKFKHHR